MVNKDLNTKTTYRYPGVKPFTTEEQGLFFGRDKDIIDLYNLIFVKQIVVLYGKSGYGKSSLINAGIIPKLLKETSYQYFSIRFKNNSNSESNFTKPQQSLIDGIKSGISIEGKTYQDALEDLTENDNSLWYWIKRLQTQTENCQIVLFFDQFEELFTYDTSEVDNFSMQLADALYSPIPVKYRQRLERMDVENKISDEFHDFLYEKPDLKVVFSVRSDRVSLLDGLSVRHPSILSNCFELAALTEIAARDAIVKPSQIENHEFKSKIFEYSDSSISYILDNISEKAESIFLDKSKRKIETAVLQTVCRYVEVKLVIGKNLNFILPEDIGIISNIFLEQYEETLSKLTGEEKRKAQELVEEKLISGGLRNSLSDAYIKQEFGIGSNLLDKLENSYLIRKERDGSGRLLYEVSHDTLVEPILKVAQYRLDVLAKQKEEQNRIEFENERKRVVELEKLNKIVRNRGRIASLIGTVSVINSCNCN